MYPPTQIKKFEILPMTIIEKAQKQKKNHTHIELHR